MSRNDVQIELSRAQHAQYAHAVFLSICVSVENKGLPNQIPKLKVASSSLVARSRNQLLTLFAITFIGLASIFYASAQTPVPDAEMREIVRLLLEREIPRPGQAADVVVLLGPNTKTWVDSTNRWPFNQEVRIRRREVGVGVLRSQLIYQGKRDRDCVAERELLPKGRTTL